MKHPIRTLLSLLLAFVLLLPVPASAAYAGSDAASEAEEGRDGGGAPATPAPASPTPSATPAPSPGGGTDGGNEGGTEAVSASVSLSDNRLQLTANGYQRLRVTTGAPPDQVNWSIDHESIAQLSASSGYSVTVTAKGAGRTFVRVRVGSGEPEICQIIVSGITLSQSALDLSAGETQALELSRYGEAESVPAAGWEWSSSNTGAAIVQKRDDGSLGAAVTGISAGSSVVTCTGGGYSAVCQITVSTNEANKISASLTNGLLRFRDILSEMEQTCKSAVNGASLAYITNLEVPTSQGILYDGYVSEGDTGFGVASVQKYYNGGANFSQIENITFMPKAGASGDVRITYTGYGQKESLLQQFTGLIVVSIDQNETTLSYASNNLAPIRFRSDDFFAYCMAANNRSLQSVSFRLPASRYGTLYYNYVGGSVYESLVSAGTRYALTYNPSINNISFVPNADYAGTFSLNFTGYDSEGRSFDGTVRISVNNPGGKDAADNTATRRLEYTTGPGARTEFRALDFSDECQDVTGHSLHSVRFTSLPSSSKGILYYRRDEDVEEEDVFYRSGSGRSLSGLSFVANRNFTGTVTLPFTGTDTRGTTFKSSVTILVNEDGAYPIEYSAALGERLYFSAADFNDACQLAAGKTLDYVRFTSLPASGTLYYGGDSQALANIAYYRSGTGLLLESVNYLAVPGQRGTVSFPYTGVDVDGDSFHGHVWITVSTAASSASGGVSYFTTFGPALQLQASDVLLPAYSEIGDVATIRLTQCDPEAGRLVTNFISPGRYSAFDAAQEYTPSTIGQVAFLPKGGYQGTALVQYVARNRQNRVYSSFLRYQINPPSASRYFTDLGDRAWAVQAVDFFRYYNILNGVTPTTYEPDGPARRGAFLTVLGRMYSFPAYPGSGGYEDVGEERYYTPSIAAASALGITDPGEYFYPDAAITRADAAVFLYRTLRRVHGSGAVPAGTYADVARFADWYEVPYYAIEAMGSLVRLGIFGGDGNGNLNCGATLTRLQMAAILYRAVI